MPLTNPSAARNQAVDDAPMVVSVLYKRPLEDAGQEEQNLTHKKSRQAEQPSSPGPSSSHSPEPASLLPEPCDTYIQLRFQLCRFKGVYRIVRLPLSFNFVHFYRYILLLFGWSGMHLHQYEIHSHVELYSRTNRPGEIKTSHSFRVPEKPDYDAPAWEQLDWKMWCREAVKTPIMRVGTRKRSYEDEFLGINDATPLDMNDPFERKWALTRMLNKQDSEVTLGDIWTFDADENLSQGRCQNDDLAIKFEYDLGSSWEVHITIDYDKENHYMWRRSKSGNRPELITVKGAPPLEDAVDYSKDIDGKKKKVSKLLLEADTFERYLKGEICSVICNTELAVYEKDEPPASVLQLNEASDGEDDEDEDLEDE